MNKIKIAYQGVEGAFSNIAAQKMYPKCEYIPCISFSEVFNVVNKDIVSIGVIPIENSYAGRVSDIHNLLPKMNLLIIKAMNIKIEHCLVSKEKIETNEIKTIHSHEQALMQCENFIQNFLPNAICIKEINTAIAADFIAKAKDNNKVAICSNFAAKKNNLYIIKENIQDIKDNYTTFIAVSKKKHVFNKNIKKDKLFTSVIIEIPNKIGSLHKMLYSFAKNKIDIVKIESYIPSGIKSISALFFVTFIGSEEDINKIKNKNNILSIRNLGTYKLFYDK